MTKKCINVKIEKEYLQTEKKTKITYVRIQKKVKKEQQQQQTTKNNKERSKQITLVRKRRTESEEEEGSIKHVRFDSL